METCDLLVRNGYLVTMDDARRRYPDGAMAIANGCIQAIGPSDEIEQRFEADRVIEAGGALVHPGFVECHLHVSLHVSRGAFSESTSWEDAVDFYVDFWNAVDDEDEHAASLLACLEMVRNGTTMLHGGGGGRFGFGIGFSGSNGMDSSSPTIRHLSARLGGIRTSSEE